MAQNEINMLIKAASEELEQKKKEFTALAREYVACQALLAKDSEEYKQAEHAVVDWIMRSGYKRIYKEFPELHHKWQAEEI